MTPCPGLASSSIALDDCFAWAPAGPRRGSHVAWTAISVHLQPIGCRTVARIKACKGYRSAPVRNKTHVKDSLRNLREDILFPRFRRLPARSQPVCSLIVSTPNSAALASFEPAPGPATTRSVLLETDAANSAPKLGHRLGLVARHMFERACENNRLGRQGSRRRSPPLAAASHI